MRKSVWLFSWTFSIALAAVQLAHFMGVTRGSMPSIITIDGVLLDSNTYELINDQDIAGGGGGGSDSAATADVAEGIGAPDLSAFKVPASPVQAFPTVWVAIP